MTINLVQTSFTTSPWVSPFDFLRCLVQLQQQLISGAFQKLAGFSGKLGLLHYGMGLGLQTLYSLNLICFQHFAPFWSNKIMICVFSPFSMIQEPKPKYFFPNFDVISLKRLILDVVKCQEAFFSKKMSKIWLWDPCQSFRFIYCAQGHFPRTIFKLLPLLPSRIARSKISKSEIEFAHIFYFSVDKGSKFLRIKS